MRHKWELKLLFENINRFFVKLFFGLKYLLILFLLTILAACSNFSFGPQIATSPLITTPQFAGENNLPPAAGEQIGSGNIRVALLLPLSGEGELANVGISMANGARLAMEYIEKNNNSSNITLVLKDTKGDATIAAQKASEAISEGASLILGPLRAHSVRSAGSVARSGGIPLIGFSNNSGAASNGVYLLNVLPEGEVRRSLKYASAQGRRSFAAILSTTDFGTIQGGAFRQAVSDLGLNAQAVYSFSNEGEARLAVEQLIPLIQGGQIDAIFIPDRATAPSFATLFEAGGIDKNKILFIGSADWDNDSAITQTPYLVGAIYPSIDDRGLEAIRPEYIAKFGSSPHPFTTIAYTATLLANSSALAKTTPPYAYNQLTRPTGFNGRDGLFRFYPDGRSDYALVIKQIIPDGARIIDGAKLP